MDAAEGNTHQLAVGGMGHAHGHAGLAGARRANQAEKTTLDIRRELFDRQVFQNPLLDLIQTVMLLVEDLARLGKINGLLGALSPRQLQTGVQIAAENRRLGGAERLLAQTSKLFFEPFPNFLGGWQRLNLLAIFPDVIGRSLIAQFGLDDLHLLPQIVVALLLVHLLLCLLGDLLLITENIQFLAQETPQQRQTLTGIPAFQDALLLFRIQTQILCYVPGNIARLRIGQHVQDLFIRHIRVHMQIVLKKANTVTLQRLHPVGVHALRSIRKHMQQSRIALGIGHNLQRFCPVQSLHHHTAEATARLPKLLADSADRAHGIDILRLGQIRIQRLLRCQEDQLLIFGCLFQSPDGSRALHVKGQEHAGEDRKSTQG